MNNTQKIVGGVVVAGGLVAGIMGIANNTPDVEVNQNMIFTNELHEKITLTIPVGKSESDTVVTEDDVVTTTHQDVDLFLANKLRLYFIYKGMANDPSGNIARITQFFVDAGYASVDEFITKYQVQ